MSAIESFLGAKEGSVITIRPKYIVINDGPSSAAVDLISSVKDKAQVVVFHDHDVPTGSPEGAALFKKLNEFRKKHGLDIFEAKGIGYSYMFSNMVAKGDIVLGAGSHGGIFSAAGALGLDVSPSELARAAESGEYSLVVPRSHKIVLTGNLLANVSAMDAGFFIKRSLEGRDREAVEIFSPLSREDNAILASVISDTASAVLFSDSPDDADETVNLSDIGFMLMCPVETRAEQDRARIIAVEDLDVRAFKAGQIGGYTAGTIAELRKVRAMLKGKKLRLGFRFSIVPATADDYLMALDEGIIEDLMDYGAQIQPFSDKSVVSQGAGAMGDKESLITTGLYTYSGCMGMSSSVVYSASSYLIALASYQEEI